MDLYPLFFCSLLTFPFDKTQRSFSKMRGYFFSQITFYSKLSVFPHYCPPGTVMETDFAVTQTVREAKCHSQGSHLPLDHFVCQRFPCSGKKKTLSRDAPSLPSPLWDFSLVANTPKMLKVLKLCQDPEGADRCCQSTQHLC